ncbi:hypothetical protein UFOVP496_19 [uncultured Caudovirales phage]|jgi:hypothetical protein|uniref:Uncharacterized protein n=1 Tax=uncultured Caudovirales phage TaxID=2100421 RepID=A0A6J5MT60_9CAUD|nr:hypothetical protein UFOVP496_19 [uncultured Caudovirales phage]
MKVRATAKCYIGNTIREEGEVFEYNGIPDTILHAVEEESPKAKRKQRDNASDEE